VFLLTDYGTKDEFAGVLRAVVVGRSPGATLVDLTHDVPSFDVRAGALALVRVAPYLSAGVVLAVVDPGVGSDRRAIAMRAGSLYLVGPDNGLLVWAAEELGGIRNVVEIAGERSRHGSSTFDGRDVFAPAAGDLLNGVRLEDLGPPLAPETLKRLIEPQLAVGPGSIETEVLWVDGFGNVQLSAREADITESGLTGPLAVRMNRGTSVALRWVNSFSEIESGSVAILVDSNGHLALVGLRSSAALNLGLCAGDRVRIVATGSEGGVS
jgi:hypothetical protein